MTDVNYQRVQSQIGAAPYALTPEFQSAAASLQIPNAKPTEIVEKGYGTKFVEKEFLDIQAQSPAALADQLKEFREQRLESKSSTPTSFVFVKAGQAEAYRNDLIDDLGYVAAELPVREDRVALVDELEIVELAEDQSEAEAMQAKAQELNNAVIILGVGREQVAGVYKIGIDRKELNRASQSLVGVVRVLTRVGGRAAKIGEGQEHFEVRAERITELLVQMLAGGEAEGSLLFFEIVTDLALQANTNRYVMSRA